MPPPDPSLRISPTPVYEPGLRKDANEVKLKLAKAGLSLDGLRWKLLDVYYNPLGFDFFCEDHATLQQRADRSGRFALDSSQMPGFDAWAKAGVLSVGFSELGTAHHLHLDFAVDEPGLCRVYVSMSPEKLRRESVMGVRVESAQDKAVYKAIRDRLSRLHPAINIGDYIGGRLQVGKTILDGISFIPTDHEALTNALTHARASDGGVAFARGTKGTHGHWPLAMSFLATDGIGFREIWRPRESDRPIGTPSPGANTPAPDEDFAANFGGWGAKDEDLSSLHCGIAKLGCNIHIDALGFVVVDENGNIVLDPDLLGHTANELIWKTNLKGKLPLWLLNGLNLMPPSSPFRYRRAGASIDVLKGKGYSVKITGSCQVLGGFECSGTFSISGSHDIGGGSR